MISTENTEKMVALTVFGEFTLADLVKDKDRMCGLLGLQCVDRIL